MQTPIEAKPILPSERFQILDILRGFALLGVLLDNIMGFSGYGYFDMAQREALFTFWPDCVLAILELAFVNGKFYSIFSLLFGIGFAIILLRGQQKRIQPLRIFYRRLCILLVIGLVHLLLVWEGDILVLYALIGFVLPVFRNLSNKVLLLTALLLILSPILIDIAKMVFHFNAGGFLESMAKDIDKKNGIPTDNTFSQYLYNKTAGWQHWRNWQQAGFYYRYSYILESNRIPKVLGIFLIGFFVGRKMMYANIEAHKPLLLKIRKWGFIIGIPCSIALAALEIFGFRLPHPAALIQTICYAISVVPLSLAYVCAVCLSWMKHKENSRWNFLAPVGRMALTNYLCQTLICIVVLYGVGFNLGGKIGPTFFFPIALIIYAIQIAYSKIWLRYFYYGPMEWLWRQLTYGKLLPMIKQTKGAST